MIASSFGARRVAAISVATLVMIPMLLLLAGLAVYVCLLRNSHTETQTGADAAALAAALALATDELLVENDTTRTEARLARSRGAALLLSQANSAGGQGLHFDPDHDVVFGRLDHFGLHSGKFDPFDPTSDAGNGNRINAVRVVVRRGAVRAPLGGSTPDKDVLAGATAMLDWSVVGFRPKDETPLPLIPVAVFTDHVGKVPHGWDGRLRAARFTGGDTMAFDAETRRFSPGSDGIPEVAVIIGTRDKTDERHAPPAVFTQIGTDSFAETVEQVHSGTHRKYLEKKFGTDHTLGVDNTLHLPGTPDCPRLGSEGRQQLDRAFRALRDSGEPRIWPLFADASSDSGTVQVSGWMAARVVAVSAAHGGGIKLVLQPTVVCHPAVVTERRGNPPAFWATNQTVCRARLAE